MLKNSSEQKKFFTLIKHKEEKDYPLTRATAYYQALYHRFGLGKWFLSWNWSAFFWGVMGLQFGWFFYRRMYLNGFLLWLLPTVIVQAIMWISKALALDFLFLRIGIRFAGMFIALGVGVFANALYFYFIKNKIEDPTSSTPQEGTNWIPLVLIGIFFFIYMNILYYHPEFMPSEIRRFFTK